MKLVKNNPVIIKTNTDELYFPSRLIYRISNKHAILARLKKLRCVYKHPQEKRWLIECSREALKVNQWNELYTKALANNDPIIIGTIKFPHATTMYVYTRSFDRVVPVLKLLDKYLPPEVAVGTHHDVCFKLMTANNKHETVTPEQVFSDESKIHYSENMRQVDLLEEKGRLTGENFDKQIGDLFAADHVKNRAQRMLINDLERKRLESFYVDGAEDYARMMKMQEMMGLTRHFAGGKLDPMAFFEQVVRNNGKPIDNMNEFLNGLKVN